MFALLTCAASLVPGGPPAMQRLGLGRVPGLLAIAALPRRSLLLLPLAVPLVAAQPASARNLVREGMSEFAANRVERSIELYDEVIAAQPAMKPYLWQRGLSLYYADRFAEGAEQFAADVAVNPNDTEEQIWHLLCVARQKGSLEAARSSLLTVGVDRRPVMRAVQALFTGRGDEAAVKAFGSGGPGDQFYSELYLGLYHEARGESLIAREYMQRAVAGAYRSSGDPMYDLARVHVARRGWASSASI